MKGYRMKDYGRYLFVFLMIFLLALLITSCDSDNQITTVTITLSKEGQGTVSPSEGTHQYIVNSEVELSAQPASGWDFHQWVGLDDNSTANPVTIVMDSDKYITAKFKEVTVSKPTFSPGGGTYNTEQTIEMSTPTDGATIYYTMDDTTPTENDNQYTTPINISSTTTLKAVAYKDGDTSDVTTAQYVLKVATPQFDPTGGSYESPQDVEISTVTPDADIYYTTDGTTPTENDNLYTNPVTIDVDTTLKARGYKSGFENSDVQSSNYEINSPNLNIVFNSTRDGEDGIFLMTEDGNDITPLTDNNVKDTHPTWSPDGDKIAYVRDNTNANIFIMNDDGTFNNQITNNNSEDLFPAWSPNGEKLVFQSNREGNWDIILRTLDGSTIRFVTTDLSDDIHPDWAPGGHNLVFASNRDGDYELYISDLYGDNLVQLTDNNADDTFPTYSPDGSKIAFVSDRDGNRNIYVINLNDLSQKQVTNNAAEDYTPHWSPDGTHIVYDSNIDGDYEIYTIEESGYNNKKLTDNNNFDAFADWR